jgi:hypothetical protein
MILRAVVQGRVVAEAEGYLAAEEAGLLADEEHPQMAVVREAQARLAAADASAGVRAHAPTTEMRRGTTKSTAKLRARPNWAARPQLSLHIRARTPLVRGLSQR